MVNVFDRLASHIMIYEYISDEWLMKKTQIFIPKYSPTFDFEFAEICKFELALKQKEKKIRCYTFI